MAVFIRATGSEDKVAVLRASVTSGSERFALDPERLGAIPGSPFAYWATESTRNAFDSGSTLEGGGRVVRQGLATTDDFRFVRTWWEPLTSESRWRPLLKGGRRSPFYRDVSTVVLWGDSGAEIKSSVVQKYEYLNGNYSFVMKNEEVYGRPGLTWPLRGITFSSSAAPRGCIPSVAGKVAAIEPADCRLWLAVTNSQAFDALVRLHAGKVGGVQYEAGMIGRTPVPPEPIPSATKERLSDLAQRGWVLCRSVDEVDETSHAFVGPAVFQTEEATLGAAVRNWRDYLQALVVELGDLRSEIDVISFDLYGFTEVDQQEIVRGLGGASDHDGGEENESDNGGADDGEMLGVSVDVNAADLAADLVSWAFGVAVGRFDPRFPASRRELSIVSDPFAELPTRSPGMLSHDDVGRVPDAEALGSPSRPSPVLVDDPGHGMDATASVKSVLDAVFGESADQWWTDCGEALGARGREVGTWLSKGFFDHHLKQYSRSRRKAPIYWPLGTGSGSYLVWLYAHRATRDSLLRVLNDVVAPRLALERRRLSDAVQEAGPNPSASQRKAMEGQEKSVDELQEFVDELSAVAPLWHPDLNDGIVVVLAPLWRLFVHHKSWSKELRKHWGGLMKGEYDWAQLAMRLWPERVIPKCAEDRSLAIAHGLQDVFWVQDEENPDKWHPRENPTLTVEHLIADRSDPAIKAALEDT